MKLPESETQTFYNASFYNSLAGYAQQKTLASAIPCSGVGVHSGMPVTLTLLPAAPHTGIVFRRVDLSPVVEVEARWDNVVDTRLCTVLGDANGMPLVGTVEHVMAALAASGIDNAVVELDGPEVPIMDGSAEPFMFLIECAGIAEQQAIRTAIKILKTITVEDGDKRVTLSPAPEFTLSFEIDFAARAAKSVGKQQRHGRLSGFREELSAARTFGFADEVAALRQIGLARGGSLDNAVVIEGDMILNRGGLRYTDEFVRHKMLDAVGDLALAGKPLLANFNGSRSGHALNNQVLRQLFTTPGAWIEVEMPQTEDAYADTAWDETRQRIAL